MTHRLKFKVGDKVRIVANRFSHSGGIGGVHKIVRTEIESREGNSPRAHQEYELDGLVRPWVTETDIELAFPRTRKDIEEEIKALREELKEYPVVDEHWAVENSLGRIEIDVNEDAMDVKINGLYVVIIDKDGVYRPLFANSDANVSFDEDGRIIDHT